MGSAKLLWANNLRALATIAVIVLHVASTISSLYPAISKHYFLTSIFIDSSVRWGVPVFIMLSGSFALENYDNRIRSFFAKMFNRIVLPFLFWSVVYLFFFSWKELTDPAKSIGQLLSFAGHQFLSGTASHLWFVYVIVSMYLVFPFLSKWTKVATEKEYIYFFVLWLFFLLIDPYLSAFDINFSYTFFTGFIGYIVLGNYLFKTTRKFNLLLLISLFLTGFLYTAIRTYFISIQENETNELFMDNLSLNICLMSFCVYLVCKYGNYAPHSTWQRMVDIICKYSYGIYLSHLLILNIFLRLGLKFEFIHPIISIPLITITCLLISCGLIMVMKKIPVLKMLAG
jgi:surface polysaccharide O-acyltransferase-like enzyme